MKAAFKQHWWLLFFGFGALLLAYYSNKHVAALIVVSIVCLGGFIDLMVKDFKHKEDPDD